MRSIGVAALDAVVAVTEVDAALLARDREPRPLRRLLVAGVFALLGSRGSVTLLFGGGYPQIAALIARPSRRATDSDWAKAGRPPEPHDSIARRE